MKILTVTNYYPPHFIGGYEIACKETMDYLQDQGHEVVVLTSSYKTQHDKDHSILRYMHLINYAKTSRVKKLILEYLNYMILYNTIRTFKPDLVYFWSLRGIGTNILKAVEEHKVAKVFEIGDFWMQGYMQPTLKDKLMSILPFTKDKEIQISPAICVSEWVREEMNTKYNSSVTYMYPNATSIPPVSIQNTKDIKFIFSGRIDEEKGLDLAILALVQFASKYPNKPFSFHIYGSGEDNYISKCKKLAKPIEAKVHFQGKVKDKSEIYTNATILLMPTRMREPFGLVVIEAMANKCAVIATNAYGPAEIIDHEVNGLLFDIEKEDELFLQIQKLYFNKELLCKIQDNAYEHVSSKYSIMHVKPKIEKLLQSIAGVA